MRVDRGGRHCLVVAALNAVLCAVLVGGQNLKTVHVSTLPELVIAMEDPMVGRIFMDRSIALAGTRAGTATLTCCMPPMFRKGKCVDLVNVH